MSDSLAGLQVILGVSGGIAAYKAVDLASKLNQSGAQVHPVMTRAATEFVSPLSFQTVTGNPVSVDMFEPPRRWSVEHIALADRADLMVVAPATANILGKMAHGIADDYLSTVYLAVDCPVMVCPAMNHRMYEHPAVMENISVLRSRGVTVLDPDEGRLASGAVGRGRLPSTETIMAGILDLLRSHKSLLGISFLVTAGPTREHFDPVRFISNPSTGKMGFALAAELARRGADVTLVSGPSALETPAGVNRVNVTTALQMREKVLEIFEEADSVIMAAAVSDVRPGSYSPQKTKKQDISPVVEMEINPDILLELGQVKGDRVLVGFALETGDGENEALRKLREKNLDLIVLNWADRPGGFAGDTNQALVLGQEGLREYIPQMDKQELASRLLDLITPLVQGRPTKPER